MSDVEDSDSDHMGYLVEQSDGDGSDGLDDASSDGASAANGLFDLEAADTDDERADSDESDAEGRVFDSRSWSEDHFFPQFQRLPIELRHRIWEFFCPDLAVKARVYWFHLQRYHRKSVVISEGPFLDQQTRPARVMLAVHNESRQLALKAFPDTLAFGSHGVVRFNAKRDVVFLDSTEAAVVSCETLPGAPGFSEHIRRLAIEPATLSGLGDGASALFAAFPNLETLHYLTSPADHKPQHLRWCTSDLVKRYSVTTFEEQPGLGEDGQHMYCWPDVENHSAFAEAEIPTEALAEDLVKDGIHIKEANLNGAAIWPMIQFSWDSDQRRFEELLAWDGMGDLDWESSDEEDDGEPNEYESEGIDDSDISDDSVGSDGGDMIVLDDDDDDDSDQDEDGRENGSEDGVSPQGQDGTIDLTGNDAESIARFSSPEQSSATLRESEELAHDSDRAPHTSRLKRPRGRVVESGSEDGSEDDVPRKRARTENTRNPIVLSSDDEEDEERKMRANRRTRAVVLESEDEEEDTENANSAGEGPDGGADWSGVSNSEDEDEESEDEAARPLSLAEKLQLHREKNPIPLSHSEDSEIEDMREDDYDARNYADFQDDEEGDEISEGREDDDQHGATLDEYGEEDDSDGY